MNKISPFLRRCLLLLVIMHTSDSTAQRLEPRIVFASNRDGDSDIYSMDVNGDNLLQLTDHPKSDEYPACSPNGRRIVFASERGVTRDLYVMDSDGNNLLRLTQDNFLQPGLVGRRIARRLPFHHSVKSTATSSLWMPMETIGQGWQNTNGKMLGRVGRQMDARLRLSPTVMAPSILLGIFS